MAECAAAVDRLCQLVRESWGQPDAAAAVGPVPPGLVQSRLRGCVERCLLARLGPELWALYASWNEADDSRFRQQVLAMRAMDDAELLQALEVREVFRGPAAPAPLAQAEGGAAAAAENASEAEAAGGAPEEDVGAGVGAPSVYRRAAAALSRIEALLGADHNGTPQEALEALVLSQLEMKTCAFEASGSRAELSSMEDILPVFIFVLVRSSVSRPFACGRLMADALGSEGRLSGGGKAVLLLESAAQHVAGEGRARRLGGA